MITRLTLSSYRNHSQLRIDASAPMLFITGANGAGKTNILESISLLAPGRGLRGAAITDLQQQNNEMGWGVAAETDAAHIATGRDTTNPERRLVRINNETQRRQDILGDYLAISWLTPQMDRLWQGDKSDRRRFLDRLVAAFDAAHLGRLTRYEQAVRERMKILQTAAHHTAWLDGIEQQMAESAVAIAAARTDLVGRLNTGQTEQDALFPIATLSLDGITEQTLAGGASALSTEDHLRQLWQQQRATDKQDGQTQTGPHRSDFIVLDRMRNLPAHLCSTGEQKALLISIILAHAQLVQATTKQSAKRPLILLLDEVLTHLDTARRTALLRNLHQTGAQCWLTDIALPDDYPLATIQHISLGQKTAD